MEESKLYVGNLSYNTTNEQLKELFSVYGSVNEVNIISGKVGFVQMSSQDEAQKASTIGNAAQDIKIDNKVLTNTVI